MRHLWPAAVHPDRIARKDTGFFLDRQYLVLLQNAGVADGLVCGRCTASMAAFLPDSKDNQGEWKELWHPSCPGLGLLAQQSWSRRRRPGVERARIAKTTLWVGDLKTA